MHLDRVKEEFFWIKWLGSRLSLLFEFMFTFLEIHMAKIVAFAILTFCCFQVNALHMIIVVLLVLSLPLGLFILSQIFRIVGVYLSLLVLTKMIYQTRFVPKTFPDTNCTDLSLKDRLRILLVDLKWMGFTMLEGEETTAHLCGSSLIVLLVMTLHAVVLVRQRLKRIDDGEPETAPDVVFPGITRRHADVDMKGCFMYLLNYGFYKFGVELTMTTAAFVIAYRMDVMSSFYAFWLLIMFSLRRSAIARLWTFFYVSVTLGVLWQYAMVLGLSPLACYEYPWPISEAMTRWLYLASYEHPPDGKKMTADFLLLIFVWRQKTVFDVEKKYPHDSYPGGSNKEVYMDYYKPDFVNPVPDQTRFQRSGLDWMKNFIVKSMLWVTLGFVYWIGVYNVNVFSLGYLVGSFVFLWIGYDLCLWHMQKILRWWNCLMAYTIIAIMVKSLYEFAGCSYIDFLNRNACWLVQLLNLGCTSRQHTESFHCVTSKVPVMYWDAACFGLMLLQRRIFLSYYFLHQMVDVKTLIHLQSRGAQLIEKLMQQQIIESEYRKKKTLLKIKKNMKRMKEWQKKIHGLNYLEPTDHATAVHMGDYYMFEEAQELNAELEQSSSSEEDDDERSDGESKKEKELTMTQFLETVFRKSTEEGKSKRRHNLPEAAMERKDETAADGTASALRREKEEKEETESAASSKKDRSRLKALLLFLTDFFESVCVSMIRFFNKHSKDYRYIDASMVKERRATKLIMKRTDSESFTDDKAASQATAKETTDDDEKRKKQGFSRPSSYSGKILRDENKSGRRASAVYAQLFVSFSFFVMSHTEFFCYVVIFLHQALSPTILSLPLPLCALLWGSLTTIRPTTTFWIVLIAYTEVTVVIKALFQNWIFPWNIQNGSRHHPYHPPMLLGIHRDNSYATADLFLLFILFLHRYKLKRLGMWKRTNEEETLPPQDMGTYREIFFPKEEGNNVSELKQELESLHQMPKNDSGNRIAKLAKWKCTSRAMASVVKRGEKTRTKFNIQEIEGNVLVTHKGRRLKPKQLNADEPSGDGAAGDVILRVYTSNQIIMPKNLPNKLSCLQHFAPIGKFFTQIVDQKGRLSADFYTLIFFFDFVTFLIVFFGFSHFTEVHVHNAGEHFFLADNEVPLTYLSAVLIHFFIIIIDRILYLRKNVVGKLVLQITLVLVIHIWMFLILPRVTDKSFTEMLIPQIYYLVKCLYFLMSAYQMRVGYPLRVQGHFLCKKYGYINHALFKGLQFIPFFNQLRILLDYVCIHSSLSIMEWIKMESIFQRVFENKCSRRSEREYPTGRGIMYPKCKKYVPGTSAFVCMVFVMWLPFFLFAIFETVSEANQPKMGMLELTMGSVERIYESTAEYQSIEPFSYKDFDVLKNIYKDNKNVYSFLSNYNHEDVAVLKFPIQSVGDWKIRFHEFDQLNQTIQDKEIPIKIHLSWRFHREERSQIVAASHRTHDVTVPKSGHTREQFARAFRGEGNPIFMPHLIPKFIQVTNEGHALPVSGFFSPWINPFRNVTLRLVFMSKMVDVKYWEMKEVADDEFEKSKIKRIPHQDENYITIYTFNEKNMPKPLLSIRKRGIIGLYLSTILVTWIFVKRFMSKYPMIMFEDMPNVDRVLQLCQDIYLARESHEFALEEDLYAKLLFLFRSPETLIKWTRIRARDEGPVAS